MRILRVAQNLYPAHPGGGAYHIHALSRDQAAMGHDVTVVTLSDDPDRPREETRDGYRVVRRRPRAELIGNQFAPGVWRDLRDGDYDLVHAHSHLYVSTNLAALWRVLDDRPLALTNHGLYSQSAPEWAFGPYLRTLGRWTFDRADVVFCYTDADRRRLRDLGVDAPVAVVPNGIDVEQFCPTGPVHGAMPTDGPVVLVPGRLVEGKNPGDALEAVLQVRESGVPARLVFCGDGPRRASLEARVAATGDESAVRFLGRVPYDEMPAVYRGADLLCLPSRAEGFPRSLLEAFASGVPAVTSALPQLRPVVPAAGRTVPLGDVGARADHLEALLADPGRRARLGRRGRTLVTERFRWTDTVEGTTDRLAELTTGPRR